MHHADAILDATRARLHATGMTVQALADLCGVAHATIWHMLHGPPERDFTVSILTRVQRGLDRLPDTANEAVPLAPGPTRGRLKPRRAA